MKHAIPLIALALAAGCTREIRLPRAAASPDTTPPPAASGTLRAGFARVDITPPPGPSTIGYGPEAMPAAGWRGRLYARAMVLEDPSGERVALVQMDMGMGSIVLHRLAASQTARSGITADRLLLTATHTHSAPGHVTGVPAIDALGGQFPGYDAALADTIATRVARAVNAAASSLQPARAAWSIEPAWGFARIRSFRAFQLDSPQWRYRGPVPADLDSVQRGVDPDWRMLRVDVLESGRWVPRGAFSVFTIHNTGIPGQNDLFDPDIFGIVSRRMEEAMDGLRGEARGPERRSVFVVANGAEGDVSPNVPLSTRCPTPRLARGRRAGPRTPEQADRYEPVPARVLAACMDSARWWTDSIGRGLAAHALAQYRALGERIASDPATGLISIARAFAVDSIRGDASVCPKPREGTGAAAGAEDGFTRYRGWKLFGILGRGFGIPADSSGRRPADCDRPKHAIAGPVQDWLVGRHGFADVVQLSVVRIGEVVLGTVPAEPTTHTGARIRAAMAASAGASPDSAAVIAVTNGYLHYVATAEESRIPFYEGSSTEYGPGEAAYFRRALAALAAGVRPGAPPQSRVDSISGYSWVRKRTTNSPTEGPDPSRIRRVFTRRCWDGETLVLRWTDLFPGRIDPGGGLVLRFDRGGAFATTDDDNAVEVRKIGPRMPYGYEWEARWRAPASSDVTVTLLPRLGMPGIERIPVPRSDLCRS